MNMNKQQHKDRIRQELWVQAKYGVAQGYGRKYMLALHQGLVRSNRIRSNRVEQQAGYAVAASFKSWVATNYPLSN